MPKKAESAVLATLGHKRGSVRGQLAEIREGLTANDTSWQRGAIINFYDTCWGMCGGSNSTTPMPNNNGNLKIQQVFIPQVDDATCTMLMATE